MNTYDGPSKSRKLCFILLFLIAILVCYGVHSYNTYRSINVVVKKAAVVEYGAANYDINSLIKEVDGEIVSIKKDIDTNEVGEQEVIVEVKKDNFVKEVPIVISVVDTVAPIINLKEEKVTINNGESYNFADNVESVNDKVDGFIDFLDEVDSDSVNYYNFVYDGDINAVGTHEIVVQAKDMYGNLATKSFILEVVEPKIEESAVENTVPTVEEPTYSNVDPNPAGNDLVSIAYSLIGSPYVAGANGPNAFDCSGFVQYVYSRVGISISRSSSTQIHDGVAVSYQDAMPGDILSWGYVDGSPTHSALYVGNGQMIHATNPRQGVIASDVAAWTRGSGTRVIAVRRIQ